MRSAGGPNATRWQYNAGEPRMRSPRSLQFPGEPASDPAPGTGLARSFTPTHPARGLLQDVAHGRGRPCSRPVAHRDSRSPHDGRNADRRRSVRGVHRTPFLRGPDPGRRPSESLRTGRHRPEARRGARSARRTTNSDGAYRNVPKSYIPPTAGCRKRSPNGAAPRNQLPGVVR
ncbi:MAG: hypothetical protein M0C28_31805 [Candidatus Moduliflexus flocculans]|nr:hypothetical protein [Candidatus Moduliflexus flocculans]